MSKSKAQLEAELKLLRSTRTAEGWVTVLQSIIRWCAIVFVVRYGYLSIDVLAGKSTAADIGVNFLANVSVSVALAWAAGAGGAYYGYRQNKLRKDTIERLSGRIRELEQRLDKNRSSSNLTQRGDTRPEDQL